MANNGDRRPLANTTNMPTVTATNTRVPMLTTAERNLLFKHNGCYKCRQFYMNHHCANCPNGWPLAAGYQMLTKAAALAAKPRGVAAITVANTEGESSKQTCDGHSCDLNIIGRWT